MVAWGIRCEIHHLGRNPVALASLFCKKASNGTEDFLALQHRINWQRRGPPCQPISPCVQSKCHMYRLGLPSWRRGVASEKPCKASTSCSFALIELASLSIRPNDQPKHERCKVAPSNPADHKKLLVVRTSIQNIHTCAVLFLNDFVCASAMFWDGRRKVLINILLARKTTLL